MKKLLFFISLTLIIVILAGCGRATISRLPLVNVYNGSKIVFKCQTNKPSLMVSSTPNKIAQDTMKIVPDTMKIVPDTMKIKQPVKLIVF